MSVEKIMMDLEKVIEEDLNSQVSTLKDEICDAFAKHRKQLASRELWLLNQADSIKKQTLVLVAKQKTAVAEAKAKMEELKRFCKNTEDMESITHASDTIAQLQKKLQKSSHSPTGMPLIKFIHDESLLRDTIFSYGRFETKSCVDSDETDSITSEKSWDVVCEKMDDEDDETYGTDKEISNCCGDASGCCKQTFEIEDIDLSKIKILSGNDFLQSDKEADFDSTNLLRGFCKANELCGSLADCVCDTPCMEMKSMKPTDPVLELHDKMSVLYHNSDQFDTESVISESQSSSSQESCDPLAQISSAVQTILNLSESDNDTTRNDMQQTNMEKTDIVADIHTKLQSILDGDECQGQQKELTRSVSYKTLPWEFKYCEERNDSSAPRESDEVQELHERLHKIFQNGKDLSYASSSMTTTDLEIDPVMKLSSRLEQILAC